MGIEAQESAYGGNKRTVDADCPQYDEHLYTTKSKAMDGKFDFHIRKERLSYTAVYCQGGYWSRSDLGRENLRSETPVDPEPVPLHRRDAGKTGMRRAIARQLRIVISNLDYLRKADKASFDTATSDLPAAARAAVAALTADPDGLEKSLEPMLKPNASSTVPAKETAVTR